MRRRIDWRFPALGLGLLLSVAAAPLSAQEGAVELGVDAHLALVDGSNADANLRLEAPFPRFRVGFMVSENIALEPALGLVYLSDLEGNSLASMDLFVNGLWHSAPLDQRPVYVGGGAGIQWISGGDDSAHQFGLSGRIGLKPGLGEVGLFRLGAFVAHYLENEDDFLPGRTEYGLEAGFSLLVR